MLLSSFSFLRDKYIRQEQLWGASSTSRTTPLSWLTRRVRLPASESQIGVVLGFCVIVMSLMLWAIIWQSQVISQQAEVIRWLRSLKLGW
jgi:hypothetical protein